MPGIFRMMIWFVDVYSTYKFGERAWKRISSLEGLGWISVVVIHFKVHRFELLWDQFHFVILQKVEDWPWRMAVDVLTLYWCNQKLPFGKSCLGDDGVFVDELSYFMVIIDGADWKSDRCREGRRRWKSLTRKLINWRDHAYRLGKLFFLLRM